MKKCRQCRKEKDESEFHIRQAICRTCLNARRRANRNQAKTVEKIRKPVEIDPIIGQVLTSSWMK